MKNLLVLMILVSSIMAFGQGGEMKVIPQKDLKTYKIYFQADMKSDVDIQIKNEKGKSVHSLKFKDKDGFILPVDFSDFATGNYTVELNSPFFTLSENVVFTSEIDLLRESLETEVMHGEKRILFTLNKPVEGNLKLYIGDKSSDSFEEMSIAGKDFGMRAFDFSDSPGNVKVSIFYENKFVDSWIVD